MKTSTNGYYARVALSFARKIDTDLIAFVRNVITLMTANTQYPAPSPTLAEVTTSVNDFETAVHDALDGGKIAIATRNAARVGLLAIMRQLAAYVQGHCNADLLALIGSGFDAVRAPSPVGTLPAPQNPRLSLTDKSGELLFRFDRVNNAYNYSIQTASAATGPWEDEDLSTASRVIIGGLTPGEVVWARACANGTAGASEWTAPTTAMAV
ncbi:MAG: hypothetical protein NTV08_07590 [Verrucomicrobia bacterium]|nr:hypothetical protein [Verrucomicrobiota bacterium]